MIKFFAVVVALPRWVLALLAADGLNVPSDWWFVHLISGLFGIGMCILEGVALAYILGAMAKKRDTTFIILVSTMILSFIGVLTPSIYSRATNLVVADVLSNYALWIWSLCVGVSTFSTVMATGYAESIIENKETQNEVATQMQEEISKWQQAYQVLQEKLNNVQSKCEADTEKCNRLQIWAEELQESVKGLQQENEALQQIIDDDAEIQKTVDKLIQLFRVSGTVSHKVAGTILGITRQGVDAHLKRLESLGIIENRNGHGVVVLKEEQK